MLHRRTTLKCTTLQSISRRMVSTSDASGVHVNAGVSALEGQLLLRQAQDLCQADNLMASLALLNQLKSMRVPLRGVDHWRGIVFLKQHDILQARQALLEELRHFPEETATDGNSNEKLMSSSSASEQTAQRLSTSDLLHRVEAKLEPYLALPPVVEQAQPLFALVYDGIRSRTMLHWTRLLSLFLHTKEICEHGLAGDFVECGVAGGGSTIVTAVAIQHFSKSPRQLHSFDTFTGMPQPTQHDRKLTDQQSADASNWSTGTCSAPLDNIARLVKDFDVDSIVTLHPGLFENTLPRFVNDHSSPRSVAFAHIDADWYESTLTALKHLYPLVAAPRPTHGIEAGQLATGILQLDDFHYWSGCRKAFDEYFANEGSRFGRPTVQEIDNNAVIVRPTLR
jgi:hypothetical protein